MAVAWFIEDEADTALDALLDRMQAGEDAIVPGLWPSEFLSALSNAVRRQRMEASTLDASISAVSDLPILIDTQPASVSALYDLHRRYGVSPYDLCYLELALRLGIPLATRDGRLRKAAEEAGVALLPEPR